MADGGDCSEGGESQGGFQLERTCRLYSCCESCCSVCPQLEQTLAALREELARSEARWGAEVGKREGATQRRVERAQRESQDLKAEITMHMSDKRKLQEELQTCK